MEWTLPGTALKVQREEAEHIDDNDPAKLPPGVPFALGRGEQAPFDPVLHRVWLQPGDDRYLRHGNAAGQKQRRKYFLNMLRFLPLNLECSAG